MALGAGLALLALAATALARPQSFLHVRYNLSQTPEQSSIYPDLAVSPDGDRVAVVWTEKYDRKVPFHGRVYLRAVSEMGGWWGNKIQVFPDGDSDAAYVYDAAVAITGATAHVAYLVLIDLGGVDTRTEVRYRTCSLTSGQCSVREISHATAIGYLVAHVDIALDGAGDPHIVWALHSSESSTIGEIHYKAPLTSTVVWVDGQAFHRDSKPAIVWESGYAHVVWQDESDLAILHWQSGSAVDTVYVLPLNQPSGSPDVAANAGRIFVVWDTRTSYDDTAYYLIYKRAYLTGTFSAPPLEVGTDETCEWGTGDGKTVEGTVLYYSTSDEMAGEEYYLDLQPVIALNEAGWPTVVWHADRSEGLPREGFAPRGEGTDYAIYYSYAITGTNDVVSWTISVALSPGRSTMGSASVGIGHSPVGARIAAPAGESGGERHLHVAYMQKLSGAAWDVYYDSDERGNYPQVYMPLITKK